MNSRKHFDVVIIGGGPGGISSAIWSRDLGLSAAIIDEKGELGGQLLRIHNPITNYPGRYGADGSELRDHLVETLKRYDPVRIFRERVESVDLNDKRFVLSDKVELDCAVIIIATGVRRRRLDVPGEPEFSGHGILESGVKEKENCAGKTVLIVGGGDAALENATLLSEQASKVYVVHRRYQFSARREFVNAAEENGKVEFRLGNIVRKFGGEGSLKSVELENLRTGQVETLKIEAALIRIGVEPNSELFTDWRGLDDKGYITVDRNCRTSIDGVFAVGDVANPVSPTIVTAAGMGATAAKSAYDLICGEQRL